MSVLVKIRELTKAIEKMGKEKPKVTIISDAVLVVEVYKAIKHFSEDRLLLELGDMLLLVLGESLVIDFFSPARIIISGTIKSVSYPDNAIDISEGL